MAILTLQSTQRANRSALPPVKNFTDAASGKMRVAYFLCLTAAQADIGSTIELVTLPAGRSRILLPMSFINASAGVASGTISIGNQAYTGFDNVAVALSATSVKAATAATAAVSITMTPATGADPTVLFNSMTQVVLYAALAGGNFPTATTFSGFFTYLQD